jgi:hypothetical protein
VTPQNGRAERRQQRAPRELPEGAYVTDGTSLFRVAHGSLDDGRGELLLELEDCRTLELVLCPAHTLTRAGVRSVTPLAAGESASGGLSQLLGSLPGRD